MRRLTPGATTEFFDAVGAVDELSNVELALDPQAEILHSNRRVIEANKHLGRSVEMSLQEVWRPLLQRVDGGVSSRALMLSLLTLEDVRGPAVI